MVAVVALSQPISGCDESSASLAFPGAEGFGAFAAGGRGGRVIEVTNLDDVDGAGRTVPGSLRAAIEAKGPRIVVFRVGGTIDVCEGNRKLEINEPFITIAGQSAPGDGIALRLDASCTSSAVSIRTHDVVIRHIRIRPGSTPVIGDGSDALSIAGAGTHDVIIDHCSLSWATDENVDVSWGANNVTVQHSIVSEGLKGAPRAVGPSGGYGMLIAEGDPNGNHTGRVTVHHNLFAHNWYRNPQIATDGLIDYRNNVVYDWGLHGVRIMDVYGPPRINFVGNYAKPGPTTSSVTRVREFWAYHSIGAPPFSYFVSNDIGPRRPSDADPQLDIVFCREHDDASSEPGVDCDPARFAVPTPFATPLVATSTPWLAFDQVLANAGATRPARDPVDLRVVDEARNGTGGDVSDPGQVGGWPSLASGTAPADGDHDGMPDAWELQSGLDPGDGSDGPADADADGYTNVEEFLNATDPRVRDAR